MAYWQTTSFWSKIKDTLGLFGTGTTITLLAVGSPDFWKYFTAITTLAGLIFSIWMDDRDGDGIVDLFGKKKVTITTDKDAEVKVTTETATTDKKTLKL